MDRGSGVEVRNGENGSNQLSLPEHIAAIPDALGFWAEATPSAPALLGADGKALTHRDLQLAIDAIVAGFNAFGVRRQSRIVLLIPSGFEAEIVLLAAMSAAIAVPMTPGATDYELTRDISRLDASLIVIGSEVDSGRSAAVAELGVPITTIDALLAVGGSQGRVGAPRPKAGPEDIAVIRHTSGTTGLPRRVPHPHRTMLACVRATRARLGVATNDVALFTNGFQGVIRPVHVLSAIANGGSCAVVSARQPDRFRDTLRRVQPTWLLTTPAELGGLLDAAAVAGFKNPPASLSRLRAVAVVGQGMPAGLAERAADHFGAPVLVRYGMSEASCIAWNGLSEAERREGSCGRPLGAEVHILDAAGRIVDAGQTGEIVIRGETLFSGYLDDPEADVGAFLPGGWFRTGDLGYLDRDGFLFLTGRLKEQINRGGVKISPAEIDAALAAHADVRDAAVFAVPDTRLGEEMIAAVVRREGSGVTTRDLRSWLFDRFSLEHAPRRIWFVERLPRTNTGKVQRGELARQWLAKSA